MVRLEPGAMLAQTQAAQRACYALTLPMTHAYFSAFCVLLAFLVVDLGFRMSRSKPMTRPTA